MIIRKVGLLTLAILIYSPMVISSGWEWANPLPQGNDLNSVWYYETNHAYAVGDLGTLLKWDGNKWTAISTGTRESFNAIWALSEDEVYIIGGSNKNILWFYDGEKTTEYNPLPENAAKSPFVSFHVFGMDDLIAITFNGEIDTWNGVYFTIMAKFENFILSDIWCSGSEDCFAVGTNGAIIHWNGDEWSVEDPITGETLKAVWGSSPTDVFAAGINGILLHWDGESWTEQTPPAGFIIYDIWGFGSNNIYALGNKGVLLHYDCETWTVLSSGIQKSLSKASALAPADILAVGLGGSLFHWKEGDWSEYSSGSTADLKDIFVLPSGEAFAVGYQGNILHRSEGIWMEMESNTTDDLLTVWGTGSEDVYAGGGDWYEGLILHWDGESWTSVETPQGHRIFSIWGDCAGEIFAVGYKSVIYHFSNGLWELMENPGYDTLTSVWGTSAENVYAVGVDGLALHYDGHTWSLIIWDSSRDLETVWGCGPSDIWITSFYGHIYKYDGLNWNWLGYTACILGDMWGSGPNDIYIGGAFEFGSVVLRWNGIEWRKYQMDSEAFLDGIMGTGNGEVIAVGDHGKILQWDGVPELGVRIDMPDFITPGEIFYIKGYLENSFEPLDNVPVYFILDVYGCLFFWDDWMYSDPPENPNYDFRVMDVPSGTTEIDVISELLWPDTDQLQVSGMWIYGAMLDPELGSILGDYAAVEWGFGL